MSTATRAVAAQLRRMLWRDRRLAVALALIAVLGGLSLLIGGQRAAEFERDRLAAEAVDRETFAGQGARNPHSVAHFSRFAFRPQAATALLDPGIGAYAGSAVWMEAHYQNPSNLRAAEDRVELGRFAELSLAWLVQVLMPLLIIALGFDALAGERERGTLAMVRGAGTSLATLVRGKARALAQVFGGALLALVAVQVAIALAAGEARIGELLLRTATWGAANALYLGVWIALTLAASLHFARARSALIALLAAWTLTALIAPRLAATLADSAAPAPAPGTFFAEMRRDIDEGMDGHDPADARRQAFERKVLAQYGVDKVEDLPVSFAGCRCRKARSTATACSIAISVRWPASIARRKAGAPASTLLSPLPALQHLSMTAAGSDIAHHLDFVSQAEAKRREIVLLLNQDMIERGAGKDFEYMADPALWRRTPEFVYAPPSFAGLAPGRALDAGLLLAWALLAALLLRTAVRRAERPQ